MQTHDPARDDDQQAGERSDNTSRKDAGGYQPKSLISSWAQNQETEEKPDQGYQPRSLITDWGQKKDATGLDSDAFGSLPKPLPEPTKVREQTIPETPADQKRMLWKGEHVPPPQESSQQLVKDAADALRLDTPGKD